MDISELDIVRLKDGRCGTVVGLYEDGKVLMLEICSDTGETLELPFVCRADICAVEYQHSK